MELLGDVAYVMMHPAQVGLAEAQQIKVARTLTVLIHTHSGKGPMSLKD
jgi:hypothetical protein